MKNIMINIMINIIDKYYEKKEKGEKERASQNL